jgi:uncharacterized protein YjiS (DUF1127 family)
MVTTEYTHHAAARESAAERFNSLAGVIATRAVTLWRAWQNRRAVAKLAGWDARMLGDIGLTASDVSSALSLPATEDPSARLEALSAERRAGLRAAARDQLLYVGTPRARTPRRHLTVIET